ncbi:MAG: MFS transporter [Clostridia bacterium]|nr:MFS transporter [Clostridia bacterium]
MMKRNEKAAGGEAPAEKGLRAGIRRFGEKPSNRLLLLFALEGVLLQYVASINGFGNNLYATNLGATPSQIALNQTIPNLTAVLLMLPAGLISDRMKSAKTVPVSMLLFMGTMYLGFGTVPALGENRMIFYFAFLAMTAGLIAAFNAQWQNLFAAAVPPGEQNRTYAFRNRLMFAIGTLSPLICGQAMSHFQTTDGKLGVLRVFYYISAAFLYLQAFILSRIRVRPNLDAGKRFSLKDAGELFGSLARNRRFLFFFGSVLFFYLGWHVDWSMWYIGETRYLGMTEAHLSYFTALCSVFQLLGIGFWARVNQKKSIHFSLPFGLFGLLLCPATIMAAHAIGGDAGRWFFMIVGSAENFPQACIALCILQMLLAVIPDRNRALTISLYTMMITLSNSLMPLLGVRIFNALGGETKAFYLFNGIVFVWRILSTSLFVYRYLLYRKKPDLFLMPEEEKRASS